MRIKSCRYINFMDFVDKTINFSESVTWVKGKNARGKTSVVGGLMWLFFDCDYDLNSNPPIRRKVNGNPVNDIDVSVECVVDQDGIENRFRKVQRRKISKSEKVVGGEIVEVTETSDTNTYYVNDVKVTLKAFNERLGDIKTLMMCSNINAFLNKKQEDIRKYLFSKIESITDIDIASRNPKLAELVPLLTGHSVEEVKAMQNTAKNNYKSDKAKLEGKIEDRKHIIEQASNIDIAELELERRRIKEEIESIDKKIADSSEIYKEQEKIRADIMQIQFDMNGLSMKENQEISKHRRDLEGKIYELNNQVRDVKMKITDSEARRKSLESDIQYYEKEISTLREDWRKESEIEFDEKSLTCKYCGQPLPEDRQEQIKEDFENNKRQSLDKITERGKRCKESIDKANEENKDIDKGISELRNLIERYEDNISLLKEELSVIPSVADMSGHKEYETLEKDLKAKKESLKNDINCESERAELQTNRIQLHDELVEIEKKIAQADVSGHEEALAEYQKELVNLEQSKTDAQKILDLLAELEKSKNNILSESVNSMFKLVRWRLFEYNKSGTYTNCCIPTIKGMSILNNESNKAQRFIGKVDICNSIQRLEGVNVPIFLDDVENLDSDNVKRALELVDCQVVLLKVTDDEELKIEG